MARILTNIRCYIPTDKDGNPLAGKVIWTYRVREATGTAKKRGRWVDSSPVFTKIFHNTGVAGEFFYDAIAQIKTKENV